MIGQNHMKRNPAILQMEDSVNRVAMMLELMGESLAVNVENANNKTGGNFAAGLLMTVDDLKQRLITDYEAALEEWRESQQSCEAAARN